MKPSGPKNIVASIQARLVQRSRELDVEHQLTLARFGGERLLYRLSKSEFADRFILKGAALLLVWLGEAIRPTKDVDLLGLANSRMKDFFDIRRRAESRPFDGETLRLAISATFGRRRTPLPSDPPLALTDEFAADPQKRRQWDAFVGRIRGAGHRDLPEAIGTLRAFLWPVLLAAATNRPWHAKWDPGGPWTEAR